MSIASKQAALLSEGLLDRLGSNDRGDAMSLKNSAMVLVNMAEHLITEAQSNLDRSGTNSTGELESSLHIENIEVETGKMSLDVMILDRYKFIDQGVKGVEGGRGKYSFKTKHPSKKMALAILRWLRAGKARFNIKYKPVSKTEKKNRRLGRAVNKSDNLKSLAYAMATSIKKKGIKPTKFFEKAVKSTEKKFKSEIAKGYKLDIIQSLK